MLRRRHWAAASIFVRCGRVGPRAAPSWPTLYPVSLPPVIESVVFRDDTDPELAWLGPGKRTAVARLSSGTVVELMTYYGDEHTFSEGSFAGLTVAAARKRFHEQDVRYLQS